MFELSGVNYEEVLEEGDPILVRVIASSSYRDYTVLSFLIHRTHGIFLVVLLKHPLIWISSSSSQTLYMEFTIPLA